MLTRANTSLFFGTLRRQKRFIISAPGEDSFHSSSWTRATSQRRTTRRAWPARKPKVVQTLPWWGQKLEPVPNKFSNVQNVREQLKYWETYKKNWRGRHSESRTSWCCTLVAFPDYLQNLLGKKTLVNEKLWGAIHKTYYRNLTNLRWFWAHWCLLVTKSELTIRLIITSTVDITPICGRLLNFSARHYTR